MEEKRYLKRKEKALSDGNLEELAVSCKRLGDLYNEQTEFRNAVEQYQQEAEIYAKLGKKLEMAKAQRMVGEMFMLLSEFHNAKDHIHIYLTTVKKLRNKVEEQRAYATLGRVHLLHGQSSSETSASITLEQMNLAERAFLKSLLLIKELTGQISKLEQLDMQARCYLNIGVIKEHLEEYEESIAYIEKAIKISKSNDIFELTHLCYISMSLLYHWKKNDSTFALRYCNLALDVAKLLPQKVKKICETLITKAEIVITEGDFGSAKQILTKAFKKNTPDENDRNNIEKTLRIVVKICQTLDELVTTSSVDYAKRKELYERLGDGCCHLQNYRKALEYYQKMLVCAQQNSEPDQQLIPIYVSLYQTYKDNKQFDRALEYLWKEYEINKNVPAEACSTLCGIAEVCEMQLQSFWTVQDIYQKAKVHAANAGDQREKLEKIVFARLRKLQLKHKMNLQAEELENEAKTKGINIESLEDDSESESEPLGIENNTPELGYDICLDDLTDSGTSDVDDKDKPRETRAKRGARGITIKRNAKGETQLHQACIAGNLELVKRLLDQGHVVNVRDHAGWIPLHEACNHGFCDIVALLLDRGALAAINDKGGTSCEGITPLYDACSNGFLDVVELLMERGADATVRTDFGETCVNGLDKWRRSATLTDGEQAQYAQVRAMLLKPLSKLGLSKPANAKPLTNSNVEVESTVLMEAEQASSQSEEENDMLPSAFRRTDHNRSNESIKTLKLSPRTSNASVQYKNVMEQMKRPNRISTYGDDSQPSSSSSGVKQKRPALLETQEVDDATWLIDDIGPEKKKRRYYTPTKQSGLSVSEVSPKERQSLSKEDFNDFNWDTEKADTPDAFQILRDASSSTTTQQRQKQAQKLRLSRTSSNGSFSNLSLSKRHNKPKHQVSLLESGFCRFRSESPYSSENSNDTSRPAAEPDSTTLMLPTLSPLKSSTSLQAQATPTPLSTTVSFKVKVENELLLVPIERKKLHEINMRWLAEESARRYYNLVGVKPVLRLKTADGFAYEESDTVNVAIEQSMILATVLEWKISSLAQRYTEMCYQMNKDVNADIQTVLERAQVSNEINLVDFWLQSQQTEPLFKALLQQSNLRVLDLTNNFLQDDGCRQLAKALPTLRQLKTLNLQGNFITQEGLEVLLNSTGLENVLIELEGLNLNQNPLGNQCLRILDKYCNSAAGKSLQELHISKCQISNLYDYDLCFFQLKTFDISYNQILCTDSLRKCLAKLNTCRLQNLNLSYILIDERNRATFAEQLVTFFESGTCEQFKRIELCGCQLNDAHIYKIVQCLCKAIDLDLLDISDNGRLSSAALNYILAGVPQLRKLVATNCNLLIDAEVVQKLAQSRELPNFMSLTLAKHDDEVEQAMRNLWELHWSDKAKVITYAANLLLYVNDKDVYSK